MAPKKKAIPGPASRSRFTKTSRSTSIPRSPPKSNAKTSSRTPPRSKPAAKRKPKVTLRPAATSRSAPHGNSPSISTPTPLRNTPANAESEPLMTQANTNADLPKLPSIVPVEEVKPVATSVNPPPQTQPTKRKRSISDDAGASTAKPRKYIKQELRDCDICAETKKAYRDFPPTSCDHDSTVCRECYASHFKLQIEQNIGLGWAACNCPMCGQDIPKEEARVLVPRGTDKKIDTLIKKVAEQTSDNYFWCPADGCGHGQKHKIGKKPWVKCSKCKAKICVQHQRLWHEGLTCAEFDANADLQKAAQKDLLVIRTTTKACPFCKRRIKKEGGCNHMTCSGCGKEWFWNEVAFDGDVVPTASEIQGRRGGARALVGEAAENVRRIMANNNALIDRRNSASRLGWQFGRLMARFDVPAPATNRRPLVFPGPPLPNPEAREGPQQPAPQREAAPRREGTGMLVNLINRFNRWADRSRPRATANGNNETPGTIDLTEIDDDNGGIQELTREELNAMNGINSNVQLRPVATIATRVTVDLTDVDDGGRREQRGARGTSVNNAIDLTNED